MKNLEKAHFSSSTTAHIIYMTTSGVLLCILLPQIYLAFKHKKLHTLVTAMALQRLPAIEAMSAFEIPSHDEAKLICQDPWVSIAVTIITILGVSCVSVQVMQQMTSLRGTCMIMCAQLFLFC